MDKTAQKKSPRHNVSGEKKSPDKGTGTKKSPAATYFPARRAVSSAQESLTSVFGMGTGIASPLWPPGKKSGRKPERRRQQRTPRYAPGKKEILEE